MHAFIAVAIIARSILLSTHVEGGTFTRVEVANNLHALAQHLIELGRIWLRQISPKQDKPPAQKKASCWPRSQAPVSPSQIGLPGC